MWPLLPALLVLMSAWVRMSKDLCASYDLSADLSRLINLGDEWWCSDRGEDVRHGQVLKMAVSVATS